jgi:hypothetical protein
VQEPGVAAGDLHGGQHVGEAVGLMSSTSEIPSSMPWTRKLPSPSVSVHRVLPSMQMRA